MLVFNLILTLANLYFMAMAVSSGNIPMVVVHALCFGLMFKVTCDHAV